MDKSKVFNGFYNYTVVATYLGMLSGFWAIACLINGDLRLSIILLMIAGVCDMFDGTIAATRERTVPEKKFGIQIDSLSDIICFGVFPALFTYVISGKTTTSLICSGIYLLCALIRLAYFNVCEDERQETETGRRKYYYGLPVTASAIVFPLFYILNSGIGANPAYVFPTLAAAMAFAFVFAFKLAKPKIIGSIAMACIGIAELIFICVGIK